MQGRRRYLDNRDFNAELCRFSSTHVGHEWHMLFHQQTLSATSIAGTSVVLQGERDWIYNQTVFNREWIGVIGFMPNSKFVEGVIDAA